MHHIDISVYEEVILVVKPENNCDCGFHVLLYVRGFEQKQIDDVDEEKVVELTKYLMYHSKNKKKNSLTQICR